VQPGPGLILIGLITSVDGLDRDAAWLEKQDCVRLLLPISYFTLGEDGGIPPACQGEASASGVAWRKHPCSRPWLLGTIKDMNSPKDPDFESRVRASFARQTLMQTIGALIAEIAAGEVAIRMPMRAGLSQQDGFVHAGIITAIVDSACGYAALSLTPAGWEVLTIEYKVNFLSPAAGELFIARGRVTKAGRNIIVCSGDVTVESEGKQKLIASMLATMMAISPARRP
jgi:uncharacterized protein (TIGR00369 family)